MDLSPKSNSSSQATQVKKLVADSLSYIEQEFGPLKPKPKVNKSPPLEKSDLRELITSTAPNLKLVDAPRMVAILAADDSELAFLKNLARAIQNQFCPVKLLRVNKNFDAAAYCLVLSTKDLGVKDQILLAPISEYENNPPLKRELWTKICNSLPVSS